MGEAIAPLAALAAEHFIPELGIDMLAQFSLLWIKRLDRSNEPQRQLLIDVVVVQMSGAHELGVSADCAVNTVQIFLYDAISLCNRIKTLHYFTLSILGAQKRQ